jgi:LCP family protein required for cell wall assembly
VKLTYVFFGGFIMIIMQRPTINFKNLSRKRIVIISILSVLSILLITALIFFFRINASVGKTFQGSAISALTGSDPLKQDANGVTNMLIFGDSSDDPGHGGATLSDSIMVLSINNKTKSAHSVSIPRDLWVQYGQKCSNGTEGKINAVYQCYMRNNGRDEQKAAESFAKQTGDILGIDIPYYAKVNYSFVRDTVDALGGIDVVIDSNDPRGIYDPSTNVKYANGATYLDGQEALNLSRARNASGGYGLPRSNFDREVNQQMIMQAIQQKALTSGVLANPVKLTNLIESLGDNIATNIKTSELQSVRDALKATASNVTSIPLNDKNAPLVTTGMRNSQSIVLPTAGLYDYTQLRAAVQQALAQ